MTFDEVNVANEPNHKVLNVLKLLLSGKSVNLNGHEVMLAETVTNSYKTFTLTDQNRVIGLDFSLEQFIQIASQVSDEEITIKLAELVLQEMKKKH